MKLSDEKARRLTGLIWRERAKRWLPLLLVVVALFAVFSFAYVRQFSRMDRTVDVHVHDGTVTGVRRTSNSRTAAVVHVHLEDGRDIDAFSGLRIVPLAGAHVVINELVHASGRKTFDVVRIAE